MDLIIKGGTLLTSEGVVQADIGVTGGLIAAIAPALRGAVELDASGRYVLPGAIDVHVHLQAPVGNAISSDNFYTGTVAAACGGTTTLIDFAEPAEGESLHQAFVNRRAEADPQVAVDYSLHMALPNDDPSRLAEIPAIMAEGCTSFKLFLAYEGVWLNDAQLINVLVALKEHGGLPIVHAENHHAIQHLCRTFLAEGKVTPRYHPLSRPDYMEGEATARAVGMARVVGLPIYIVHVSCADALRPIQEAQAAGFPAYGETEPHYLLLTAAECDRPGWDGAKFIMSPPLREPADQKALWEALAAGQLQVVATDHCPFFFEGQKNAAQRFTDVPNGVPGVEARLALMYTFGVRAGRMSLERWVETCCTAPARLFGLYPRKGQIAVGADADLVIFDPRRSLTLTSARLHENTDYTPFEGMQLQGYPEVTILRGRVVACDGKFVGQAGDGRYVARGRCLA